MRAGPRTPECLFSEEILSRYYYLMTVISGNSFVTFLLREEDFLVYLPAL